MTRLIRILRFAQLVLENKKYIAMSVFAGLLLGTVISFLVPSKYVSTVTFLVSKSKGNNSLFQAGMVQPQDFLISTIGKNPNDLYLELLNSNRVLDSVIKNNNLHSRYGKKNLEDTEKKLRASIDVNLERGNIIRVTVVDRDRFESAKIAASVIKTLQTELARIDEDEARSRLVYFQQKCDIAKNNLQRSEDNIVRFRLKNGQFSAPIQSEAAAKINYEVAVQIAENDAKLSSLRSFFTEESAEYKKVVAEGVALRSQLKKMKIQNISDQSGFVSLSSLPKLEQEYLALLREYKTNEQIYLLLVQQQEIASLDKDKGSTAIQVIDLPRPSENRKSPNRLAIIAAVVTFFLAGSIVWVRLKVILNERVVDNKELSIVIDSLREKLWRTTR